MVTQRRWKELVREGRLLVLKGAEGRVELARRSFEIAPMRSGPGGIASVDANPAGSDLRSWCEEIDVEPETLRGYRDVVHQWGGADIVPTDVSWSVLRELCREDDPHGAFAEVRRIHGKVNILTVREFRGKASAGVRSTSSAPERAKLARELLADDEVRDLVVRDDTTRVALDRSTAKHHVSTQIRNQPGAAARGRDIEIEHAPFFRAMAEIGGGMFLAQLRGAAASLALLAEHDVSVPEEVMDSAVGAVRQINGHLDVLALRAGLNAWRGAEA